MTLKTTLLKDSLSHCCFKYSDFSINYYYISQNKCESRYFKHFPSYLGDCVTHMEDQEIRSVSQLAKLKNYFKPLSLEGIWEKVFGMLKYALFILSKLSSVSKIKFCQISFIILANFWQNGDKISPQTLFSEN